MWIPTKKLHPAVGREVNRLTRTLPLAHRERRRASAAWNRAWFGDRARGLGLALAAMVAFVGLVYLVQDRLPEPWGGLAAPLAFMLCGLVALPYLLHQANGLSPRDLGLLLPGLDLSPTQRASIETLAALDAAGRPTEEALETLAAMNALLDEEARLTAARERLCVPLEDLAPLEAERAGYRAEADAAEDPPTHEAYVQSLVLLDERIASLHDLDRRRGRIDAHLALLRQAVFATRDAARRLASVPAELGEEFATGSLRAALALTRAQIQATESALAELRATLP